MFQWLFAKAPVSRCPQRFYFDCVQIFVSSHTTDFQSWAHQDETQLKPFLLNSCFVLIPLRFSCFANMQQPTQQTFFAALPMHAWEPYRKVPCSYSWLRLLRLVLVHSGFDGDWLLCNLLQVLIAGIYLKFITAVGFHRGGHSCIDDEVLANAVRSCSVCI